VGDRSVAPGDAKDVWEVNRHLFLIDLCKAWRLTGRPEYAEAAVRLINDWIVTNPYARGVNWAGPLEVAYRALSWLWLYHLVGETGPVDEGTRRKWLASMQDHGRFLYRHLELYESPFNHLMGEATVLYLLGLQLPQLHEAPRWRRRGRAVIESRLAAQFYADGGSVEQATVYHHATLGFLLLGAVAARQAGEDFGADVWEALERAVDFSTGLMQPDGRHPAIGDNDDARPLAFDYADNWDFRHLAAIGAVLFARPGFKFTAGRFSEDALWLLGPAGLEAFERLQAASGRSSRVFEQSGYVVLRSGLDARADYVCFDCGEQAGGLRTDDVPSAAHGHADALSVIAHLAGTAVLVDAGFFTYDGERDWERFFRETAAHNTIRVNGRDQATHLQKMAWTHVPTVTLHEHSLEPGHQWACASHDGYNRADGLIHRRTVWLRPDRCIVLYDELLGGEPNTAELAFQFAAEHTVATAGAEVAIGEHFTLLWSASTATKSRLYRGGTSVDAGWVAPRLGQRQAAPRLVLDLEPGPHIRILTAIVDRRVWSSVGAERDPHALTLRLHGGPGNDTVVAPLNLPIAEGPVRTDAALVAWRSRGGAHDVRYVRGRYAEVVA
jgi:hypothetical protein